MLPCGTPQLRVRADDSLLFDLSYKFIHASFSFSRGEIYILSIETEASLLALAKSIYYKAIQGYQKLF